MNSCGGIWRPKIRISRHFPAFTYITYKTYIFHEAVDMWQIPVLDFTIIEWYKH